MFQEREWLTAEIDAYLASRESGYIFIEADSGMGKTSFAAWLAVSRHYLSHFSGDSGGKAVLTALGNLSAQLILEFGLDDRAPGGMVPEWAQTPAGFERLLHLAAAKAREQGRQLIIVADDLAEAERPDQMPFGLPRRLPAGVYVVGTYRTGASPGQPETPPIAIAIRKDDPRNREDIHRFLTRACHDEAVADRLDAAGMETAPSSGYWRNEAMGYGTTPQPCWRRSAWGSARRAR